MQKAFLVAALTAGAASAVSGVAKAQCDPGNRFGDCTASPAASNCGCDWFDDIEGYAIGTHPGTAGVPVNGWEHWRDSAASVSGFVTNEQNHTPGGSQSLRIDPNDDQVRVFQGGPSNGGTGGLEDDGVGYDGEVSPAWSFQAWNFVPGGQSGDQFLIVLSRYNGAAGPTSWNVQTSYNAGTGLVTDQHVTNLTLPVVTDEWVLTDVFINLQDDQVLVFYDDVFFYSGIFSIGDASNPFANDPVLDKFVGALDLFSNGGAQAIFWDDLSLVASEIPSVVPPSINCQTVERDDVLGCCEYAWTIRNNNLDDSFAEFWLDIEAGSGGDDCLSLTAPTGWTCQNCTGSLGGHSLWRCLSDAPANDLDPGDFTTGRLVINPNQVAEVDAATGLTVPGLSILMHAAQGPQFDQICASGDFSFGPTGLGEWGPRSICTCFINAPSLSTWAKAALGVVLVSGGVLLTMRSRRTVAA